jgi:hypothetical protein
MPPTIRHQSWQKRNQSFHKETIAHRITVSKQVASSDFNTIKMNEPEHEHRWTIHLQASLNIYIEEQQTVHGHYFAN